MSLTARGFEDLALDNMVIILGAYVTAQKVLYLAAHPTYTTAQINAAVGFTVERDRLTPPDADDLALSALVVLGFDTENPKTGLGKATKGSTASFFADLYVAKGETSDGLKVSGDKGANSRLLYLKAQVESGLFNLANFDIGFPKGTIVKKPFGRWQNMTGTDETGEIWQVSGRWTFDFDYEWSPESPTGHSLDIISVNAGLWSALYNYP